MGLAMRQLVAHAIERTPSGGEVIVNLRLSTAPNGRDRRESGNAPKHGNGNPGNLPAEFERQASVQHGVCTSVQIRELQAQYQESQTTMGRAKRLFKITDQQKQRRHASKTKKYLIVEVRSDLCARRESVGDYCFLVIHDSYPLNAHLNSHINIQTSCTPQHMTLHNTGF